MDIREKVLLKKYSTYNIGGETEFFCLLEKQKDIVDAVDFSKRNKLDIFFLGGGSNILFSDSMFNGLVAKINNDEIEILKETDKNIKIKCGAGVLLSKLSAFCVQHGLGGFEWSTGIPGTIGGAIRGNAGAFKGEMKEHVLKVWVIDMKDQDLGIQELDKEECSFDYRYSIFKENENLLVWEVEMQFEKSDIAGIKSKMKEIVQKRKGSQPLMEKYPSAGCVFKNPTVSDKVIKSFESDQETESRDGKVPAGWLIDRCDLKGEQIGGAMVSREQANFIVNTGEATSEDVIILMSLVKMKVRNQFKVQLEEEVKILL